jgi:AbrB family looped-hinge helix DNA binding protein
MLTETAKVGKRGTVVIPMAFRQKYGFKEGSQLLIEASSQGILLRPVVTLPVEIYTPERKAEFLLNNAITTSDYVSMCEHVRKMGLDPRNIPHIKLETK